MDKIILIDGPSYFAEITDRIDNDEFLYDEIRYNFQSIIGVGKKRH